MELNNNILVSDEKYLTETDVKVILEHYCGHLDNLIVESYSVYNASDKMLGFLADYWKLQVNLILNNQVNKVSFFIKAVSRSNAAKAAMVKELKLFAKEILFYTDIKKCVEVPGLKPWSPKLIAVLNETIVFEDLNSKNYKVRNKFLRFDQNHTEQALQAVARFHASSIIFEERKIELLKTKYSIDEDFEQLLDSGGYTETDAWYYQCMNGALEAVKTFSKHSKDAKIIKHVESKWKSIWVEACECKQSSNVRNVICHRDLWNNNILFHYKDDRADDCLMVDFQAVRSQPPSTDVMLLLYCNLDPKFREDKMDYFLDYYYEELKNILGNHGINLEDIFSKKSFQDSAEEQRKWGLIICACLIPQFWINDELTTKIFCDSSQFNEILSKNKASFIMKMMMENADYKEKLLEIFDEIVERYCLV